MVLSGDDVLRVHCHLNEGRCHLSRDGLPAACHQVPHGLLSQDQLLVDL